MTPEERDARRKLSARAYYERNKECIKLKVKANKLSKPELYRELNRKSAAKRRAEEPERFLETSRKHQRANQAARTKATKEWASKKPGIYLYYNAKARAKKLNLPFDIELSDIVPLPAFCPALGIPIEATVKGRRGFHPNSPSVDRILPAKGYTKGNVRVISNRANWIKRDATAEELRAIATYIEREVG